MKTKLKLWVHLRFSKAGYTHTKKKYWYGANTKEIEWCITQFIEEYEAGGWELTFRKDGKPEQII